MNQKEKKYNENKISLFFYNKTVHEKSKSKISNLSKYKPNKKIYVLLGDNYEPMAIITNSILESIGCKTTIVPSVSSLVQEFKENKDKYNVIITNNIYSNKGTGIDVLKLVKKQKKDIKVIVLAVEKNQTKHFINFLGFDGYLEKPLSQRKAISILSSLIPNIIFKKIEPITINEGSELILPKNPTYSGYTFKCWEDKNEKPIYNNVVLAEDTTLYAKWEKDEPKKSNTKKEDQKKDKPKEVVYYCDSGYVLEGTKCTKTEKKISEIIYSCSSPYSLSIDDKCIDITKKTDLVKVCAEYKGYKGVIAQGSPLCFYHDIGPGSSYQECVSIHNSQEVGQYNGRCYEFKKMKDDNSNNLIISSCPEGYT